jgi:hypothetical protein
MRLTRSALLAFAALLAWGGGAARADYQFQFADASGNTSSAFTVNQGSTVDIKVYLVETNGGTTLSTTGLSSGGVKLTGYNTGVATVTNAAGNPGFDFSTTGIPTATVNNYQDTSPTLKAPTSGADANRILLGTFTFTGVSAGSTLAVTADPGALNDNVLGSGFGATAIDGLIQNASASITVTAVPEPGTIVLTGLLATGLAGAGFRRVRRSA